MVSCATTIERSVALTEPSALSGFIQKTAPPVSVSLVSGVDSSHLSKLTPIMEMALAVSPSVMPIVSQESYWANPSASLLATAQKAGLVPPVSAPKGGSTW